MRRQGFVLMETIVVITILCVILLMLYSSYYKILNDVKKRNLYENTEYIYKTNLVREYLEEVLDESSYNNGSSFYIYCRNSISDKVCYDDSVAGDYKNRLFKRLGVESVYITFWDASTISHDDLMGFEATTQNYIKSLDATSGVGYRIIVMFKSENNDTENDIYEYATLKFGSRN